MGKKLLIVESPAKARSISSMLDDSYSILSSIGHIRDLPKTRFGVSIEENFKPEYVTISGKQSTIDKIKKASKDADVIYLAADPDREGEAICWHLAHYLNGAKAPIHRIMYFEITPQAIQHSLENPLKINGDRVNAQQARRILDRIVGYRLSPLLWNKIRRGLSAGRVQSVALKLICDREREIRAFESKEYWMIKAELQAEYPPLFNALYFGSDGKRNKIQTKDQAEEICRDTVTQPFTVQEVLRRKVMRHPPAPFITSTLQQEASRKYRYPAQKTMRLAQALYEGKQLDSGAHHGLITYMRTDSPRVSQEAQSACREMIAERFGTSYVPDQPPTYKPRKNAQEAHEAIRPTSVQLTPELAARHLSGDELKLYKLIWERFVASQMASACLNVTTIKLNAGYQGRHHFRASGSEVVFNGFWELVGSPFAQAEKHGKPSTSESPEKSGTDESDEYANQMLPALSEHEVLTCKKLDPSQHFTKPPPRFSEATLVRELEMQGIGRPSTYATIMATIREHDYVDVIDRRFHPTELGFLVSDLLSEHFPEIMSVRFSAEMESRLDKVEDGLEEWTTSLRYFYKSFELRLKEAEKQIKSFKASAAVAEGIECPICHNPMVIRWGKRGQFLSCSRYPECRGILPYQSKPAATKDPKPKGIQLDVKCESCGSPMVLRHGRFGLFLSCSQFPKCKSKPPKPEGLPCAADNCDGHLVLRHAKGRRQFWGCSRYPACSFILNSVPIKEKCPHCGFDYIGAQMQKTNTVFACPRCKSVIQSIHEEPAPNAESDSEVSNIS